MNKLKTSYMGIELKNPLIAASSGLTSSPEKMLQCEKAGLAAVIVKSLFQEDIDNTIASMDETGHPEEYDYLKSMQTGFDLEKYCTTIRTARKELSIPIFASMNASRQEWWVEYLPQIEKAGADGIELNLSFLPQDKKMSESAINDWFAGAVRAATRAVSIPVAVKIGPYFSSIPRIADELHKSGAKAIVLFNRFFQFDINIDDFTLKSGSPFSSSNDLSMPLRWISLLYGNTPLELSASSGVHNGKDAVKALLAGAQTVQLCSTLYQNGVDYSQTILETIEEYMNGHHFRDLSQLRGKMSRKQHGAPEEFERLQYIKSITGN